MRRRFRAASLHRCEPARSQPRIALPRFARAQGRRARSSTTPDATSTVPARATRVYAAGPPASVLVFAVAPDALLGWTTVFPRRRAPVRRTEVRRPAHAGPPDRSRQHRQRRGRARGEAGPDRRLRRRDADLRRRSPTACSSRSASRTCCSTARSIASPRRSARSARSPASASAPRRSLATRATPSTRSRVGSQPFRRAKRPRVYYARGPRGLDTGLAGSINVESDRARRRDERRRGAGTRRTRAGLARAGARWDPEVIVTTDPNFEASVRRDPLWRDIAGGRSGPRAPRARRAVRLDRLSAVDEPADRAALARARALSRRVPRGPASAFASSTPASTTRRRPTAQLDALLATAQPRRDS